MKFVRYIKFTIFIALTLVILTGCSSAFQSDVNENFGQADYNISSLADKVAKQVVDDVAILSAQNRGVDITIENVIRENEETIVAVAMNNHAYDLTSFDVLEWSFLDGIKATDYIIEESNMGGHHVTSKIIFSGELEGSLIIGFDEDFIFNFSI